MNCGHLAVLNVTFAVTITTVGNLHGFIFPVSSLPQQA